MASRKNYENNYKKDNRTGDVFRKRKDMVLSKDVAQERRNNQILWVSLWRRNMHKFITDMMQVKLYPYQIIWIYLMNISPFFVGVASRSSAKSFIVACFVVAKCILWPSSTVLLSATTLKQSGLIVSNKISWLRENSPLCAMEIKTLTANNNQYYVDFHNGSKIVVVAANEGSRGWRSNDLIIDEYAITNKEIVDQVLKPTLFPRQAPFLQKPEYEHLIEPVRLYMISSARYTSEWWYKTALMAINDMINDNGAGFFATDYLVSVKHNLKTKEQIEQERKDNAAFSLEYENIPGKANLNSYYQIGQFKRTTKKAFYPVRMQDYALKKNPFSIPKVEGELRVIGLDFASRAAKTNDNSVISCIRLLPSKKGYLRSCVYMESSHGANHIVQANRVKDIFYDFQADYLGMDIANVGWQIFINLTTQYYNEERGIQIPAFTVMDIPEIDEKLKTEMRDNTLGMNAIPIIFPISATANINTEMHVAFRSSLQKKLWAFLVDDVEAERFLVQTNKDFFNNDDEGMKAWLLHPYVQTNLLVSEAINLEMQMVGSNIKLTEGAGRKDRYSSIIHGNYLISILDKKLLKEGDSGDEWETLMNMTLVS